MDGRPIGRLRPSCNGARQSCCSTRRRRRGQLRALVVLLVVIAFSSLSLALSLTPLSDTLEAALSSRSVGWLVAEPAVAIRLLRRVDVVDVRRERLATRLRLVLQWRLIVASQQLTTIRRAQDAVGTKSRAEVDDAGHRGGECDRLATRLDTAQVAAGQSVAQPTTLCKRRSAADAFFARAQSVADAAVQSSRRQSSPSSLLWPGKDQQSAPRKFTLVVEIGPREYHSSARSHIPIVQPPRRFGETVSTNS
uniref:Uncharacterized protein n=1 Tax=Plectus sambesii TaxID=2011161 RepID=A0A914XDF8_9BILA